MADDGGVLGNLPHSRPGPRSAKRPAQPQAPQPPPAGQTRETSEQTDPIGAAIRTAAGVAATGAKVASDVGRELVRRLPRP